MGRAQKVLTVVKVRSLKAPGRYSDGGGLYLYIGPTGNRSWVFRYRSRDTGKLRDMGLGRLADVTLEQARDKAAAGRASLLAGLDPLDAVKQASEARTVAARKRITVGEVVTRYIAAHKSSWRNAKHRQQWRNTLDKYATPLLDVAAEDVDTAMVLDVLSPIWGTVTETATRVRQRLEAVFDYAIASGNRSGANPARWRGHLAKLLPAPTKIRKVKHHAALPYNELGAFMRELLTNPTLGAQALALQVLTATRPGEAAGARWSEFDQEARVWTIPPERMKAHREHRVPYSTTVDKLLKALPRTSSPFLFPSYGKSHVTTQTPLKLLKELRPGMTLHGFRSTFRDWAADLTAYPSEVAEAALAHVLKDKTEAAYRRSDLMEKRARMMADWERFATRPQAPASVTPINAKRRKEAARA